MANVVTKLIVDSQDYDNKIKRASEGLQHYAEACKKAGGTLEFVDEEALAFARDLGKMETVATSARQKMREYNDAIVGIQATLRQMTDEERNGQFGQALTASLGDLKIKAAELKDIMSDTNIELKAMASDTHTFDALSQGFTSVVSVVQVGIGAMQAFGVKNEDAMQAMAKLQGVMAVTNGLTKIQAALQKQSAVMVGVTTVQKKAAAAAEARSADCGQCLRRGVGQSERQPRHCGAVWSSHAGAVHH